MSLFLSVVLFLVTFVGLCATYFARKEARTIIFFGSGIAFALGSIFLTFASIVVVDAGNVGVPVFFGQVQQHQLNSGIHIANPLMTVKEMSIRTESYSMGGGENDSIVVISSNGLKMPMDLTIPYRLLESEAPWVYKNFGPNYIERILRPATRTAIRRAGAKFTDHECWATKRDELAQQIQVFVDEEMSAILKEYGETAPKEVISISQVLIGNITIPDTVKTAIEKKLAADQEQQAMEFRIMREEKEAKRKEIEAKGIQTFQDIVSKGINEDLLRWKGIEATIELAKSDNSKVVVIGSGKDGLPIILNAQPEAK